MFCRYIRRGKLQMSASYTSNGRQYCFKSMQELVLVD